MKIQLENELIKVVVCPEMGGKILSLFHKEGAFEAAAQPGKGIAAQPVKEDTACLGKEIEGLAGKEMAVQPGGRCFAKYAYGLDDAFPNIDEEDFMWNGRERHYPDHGQIWDADFQVLAQGQDWLKMRYDDFYFSYCYKKELCLVGDSLRIHYKIENIGKYELPAFWTWHGLMRYEEDMEIIFPEGIQHCRNVLADEILGEVDTIYPLENPVYDFRKVPPAGSMVKYYVEPEAEAKQAEEAREGKTSQADQAGVAEEKLNLAEKAREPKEKRPVCCGFSYPSKGMRCMLHYDANKLPYLGVWITAGGFQGDYNCALEPSNGFYDSVGRAAQNGRLPILAPGEKMDFELTISLKHQGKEEDMAG